MRAFKSICCMKKLKSNRKTKQIFSLWRIGWPVRVSMHPLKQLVQKSRDALGVSLRFSQNTPSNFCFFFPILPCHEERETRAITSRCVLALKPCDEPFFCVCFRRGSSGIPAKEMVVFHQNDCFETLVETGTTFLMHAEWLVSLTLADMHKTTKRYCICDCLFCNQETESDFGTKHQNQLTFAQFLQLFLACIDSIQKCFIQTVYAF